MLPFLFLMGIFIWQLTMLITQGINQSHSCEGIIAKGKLGIYKNE
jgi:hypothetical protein